MVESGQETSDVMLDACGLECPMPLLKTKLALARLQSGQVLHVTASDPGSWRDIPAYLELSGNRLLSAQQHDGLYDYRIEKA